MTQADTDVEGVETSDESGLVVFGLVSIHQDVFFLHDPFSEGEKSREAGLFSMGVLFLSSHTSFLCLFSVLPHSGCCLSYGEPN